MIKKLKKVNISIFLAVILGAICGKLVCEIYTSNLSNKIDIPKIYLIQAGAYSSYDNMVSNTNIGNYIYYEDEGMYKTIIGITENPNNIEKIKNTYKDESIVIEYYSEDTELNNKIKDYDKRISNTEDPEELKNIVLEMLDLYKSGDNIVLKIE